MTYEADVAIIGAGPAGSSAATVLAKGGARVLIFDQEQFPREKPCCDYLNPGLLRFARDRLGIPSESWLQAGGHRVDRVRLFAGVTADIPILDAMDQPAFGVSLRRSKTDSILLDTALRAGAVFYPLHRVRALEVRSGTVVGVRGDCQRGAFECRAALTLACDGTHSIAARQLNLVRPIPRLQQVAVVAHLLRPPNWPDDVAPNHTVVMFASGPDRFVAGLCAQEAGRAVLSIVLPKDASRDLSRLGAESFVRRWIAARLGPTDEPDSRLFESLRTTACYGHTLRSPHAPGILFAGDAACFTDPFTGEGVHHAVEGGALAGGVALDSLASGDTSTRSLRCYGRHRRQMTQRYRLSAWVHRVVSSPRAARHVAERMSRRPKVAQRLVSCLNDLRPPSDLFELRLLGGLLAP
jgi:menaquinone-9 beta-reductase